ncbi:MAG: D-lysine 5,6-aminomutase beta subunit [bacterium ADurb.Bin270]|nr:hypothetical protein [Myxococcales bacterium]OQA62060.1 MAG: D-lysine 5,6-aminomutase beta subunit [bacterium ADurb.Bin270]
MLKVNKKKLKAYGDRLDDGAIQLSFTLPVSASPEAKEAAKRYIEQIGLEKVSVATMESMGDGFSHFIVYGRSRRSVDFTKVKVPKVDTSFMHYDDLKNYMSANITRPIVVVGAAIGSDAHTVGIDAIMNMKGFAGDYGLERYPLFKAHNLRSQITSDQLIEKAVELKADAILISQVVTQRDSHLENLKEFKKKAVADSRLSKDCILIVGGPRIDHALGLKLGFDAGFGVGTKPSQVASFLVQTYMKRKKIQPKKTDEQPKTVSAAPLSATSQGDAAKPDATSRPSGGKRRRPRFGRGRRRPNKPKRSE